MKEATGGNVEEQERVTPRVLHPLLIGIAEALHAPNIETDALRP